MPNVIDWTVDRLLSGVRTLNARAESAQNTIRANRARYLETLRSLPAVTDVEAREALRTRLREWIRRQVTVENRFNSFASNYLAAKSAVKRFLQGAGVSPPGYLGAGPIVIPAAVYGGLTIAFAVLATIVAVNASLTKSLDQIAGVLKLARDRNWTAAEPGEA